jgi:hypothetical protein
MHDAFRIPDGAHSPSVHGASHRAAERAAVIRAEGAAPSAILARMTRDRATQSFTTHCGFQTTSQRWSSGSAK